MRRNAISFLVAVQSVTIGLWLVFHHGKLDYTNKIRGFQHMAFLNSPYFYLSAILLGGLLIFAILKQKEKLKKWTLSLMNTMWAFYTVVLIINEINGVANMSWALMLGYNVAIYLAARYEVSE